MCRVLAAFLLAGIVAGCAPDYSPDTYATNAVQQANKVDRAIVVGVRQVDVKAAGTAGAVTGAAAGAVAGAQTPGGSVASTFGGIGGSLVGGLIGTATEHTVGDTQAFEYIVRKPNGDLLSVTQTDKVPLPVGERVLVIAGPQARIVPDYTIDLAEPAAAPAQGGKPAAAPPGSQQPTAGASPPAAAQSPPPAKATEPGPPSPPATVANPPPASSAPGIAAPGIAAPGTAGKPDAGPAASSTVSAEKPRDLSLP